MQEHERRAQRLRFNGRCTELEQQHARLLAQKAYHRAHAALQQLRSLQREQACARAEEHAARQQAAQKHLARRHARDAHVLQQRQEEQTYKILKAQHEDGELRVRQRHAAVCALAREHQRHATTLEVRPFAPMSLQRPALSISSLPNRRSGTLNALQLRAHGLFC